MAHTPKSSITVVAHNIRSTHNVGSIFRTCEGFGVTNLILSGYTPYPTTPNDTRLPHQASAMSEKIHKTALGAETLVPFQHVDDIETWLHDYQGVVVGLEQSDRSIPIQSYASPKNMALILGEEVNGIESHLLTYCNDIVEIPMHGQKESFNVSVACGIALFALTT